MIKGILALTFAAASFVGAAGISYYGGGLPEANTFITLLASVAVGFATGNCATIGGFLGAVFAVAASHAFNSKDITFYDSLIDNVGTGMLIGVPVGAIAGFVGSTGAMSDMIEEFQSGNSDKVALVQKVSAKDCASYRPATISFRRSEI